MAVVLGVVRSPQFHEYLIASPWASVVPALFPTQTVNELQAAVMRCLESKPEAIIQLGTNLHFAKVAADAERWLKLPVFSSGTVIYWSALRKMGIHDKIRGFGSLLEHH